MAGIFRHPNHNKILALLPEADYAAMVPELTHVVLPRGMTLAKAEEPLEFVYFLTSGIGSVIAVTPEGNRAEAGLFGFDGYVPTSAVAGSEVSPHDVIVQVDADGYRMPYHTFRRSIETNRNLFKLMMRSMEAFSVQLAHTAVSNAVHEVSERLARWLLMCHDRLPGNEIGLTHEYIAIMLAVRRPSVTTALHVLEGNGFIKAERGNITVRNRAALEEFAHDAYGKPEEAYRRLMNDLF
jgi:CRP-like cAMP-binding protein